MDREIWIVTAAADNRRGGLVATWVSQASIDRQRPTVMAGIAPNHFTAELIDASGAFALHLIGQDQDELVWNFAIGSGRDRDKLAGLDTKKGISDSPVLCNCLAWLDCRVVARVDVGDRLLYLADVLAGKVCGDGIALTEQTMLTLANEEQKQQLAEGRKRDVTLQQPLARQWRERIPAMVQPVSSQRT